MKFLFFTDITLLGFNIGLFGYGINLRVGRCMFVGRRLIGRYMFGVWRLIGRYMFVGL